MFLASYGLSDPHRTVLVTFLDRLRVNAGIIHNKYLVYPVKKGDHDEWCQVGRGQITDLLWCGRHTSFFICRDKEAHEGVVYHDVDYSKKDAVVHGHIWCKNKDCPKCFLDGWVGHASRAIWGKLSAGVKRGYGDVEHFSISFSRSMWGLPQAVLRKKAEDACLRRGISGALVSHARRINRRERCLEFGIHYHGLGFVKGLYDRCRECSYLMVSKSRSWCSNADDCEGFEQRTRREYQIDGVVVKVMGKRASGLTMEESVIKTVRYILSHASYVRSFRKRFYIVSYFGACANKKLKSLKVRAVHDCPVCASVGIRNVMSPCSHWGSEFIATDIGDSWYVKCFPSEEFDKSGLPKFVDYDVGGSSE